MGDACGHRGSCEPAGRRLRWHPAAGELAAGTCDRRRQDVALRATVQRDPATTGRGRRGRVDFAVVTGAARRPARRHRAAPGPIVAWTGWRVPTSWCSPAASTPTRPRAGSRARCGLRSTAARVLAHCTGASARRIRAARRPYGDHTLALRRRSSPRFPRVELGPDVLYVDAGPAAPRRHRRGHRRLASTSIRPATAPRWPTPSRRRTVVPPHRDGGQARASAAGAGRRDRSARVSRVGGRAGRRAAAPSSAAARGPCSPRDVRPAVPQLTTGTTPDDWLIRAAGARSPSYGIEVGDLPSGGRPPSGRGGSA